MADVFLRHWHTPPAVALNDSRRRRLKGECVGGGGWEREIYWYNEPIYMDRKHVCKIESSLSQSPATPSISSHSDTRGSHLDINPFLKAPDQPVFKVGATFQMVSLWFQNICTRVRHFKWHLSTHLLPHNCLPTDDAPHLLILRRGWWWDVDTNWRFVDWCVQQSNVSFILVFFHSRGIRITFRNNLVAEEVAEWERTRGASAHLIEHVALSEERSMSHAICIHFLGECRRQIYTTCWNIFKLRTRRRPEPNAPQYAHSIQRGLEESNTRCLSEDARWVEGGREELGESFVNRIAAMTNWKTRGNF